jgi:hypothetical protein
MLDRTLQAVPPRKASRGQAVALAKQRGLASDSEQRDELMQWLEEYFAGHTVADEKGDDYKDALVVADALYDHVSATWLAKCFEIPLYSLRKALGKDGVIECRGEGCEEIIPMFLLRVKNGYIPEIKHRHHIASNALCPSCKKVFEEELSERALANIEQENARQLKAQQKRNENARRKRILFSHLPRRGRGNFEKFLSYPNILRLALTRAANKVLTTPVQFITTARFTPERYSSWFYWAEQERFQETEITYDQCYKGADLAVFSRDLLDVYFSFAVQNEDYQIVGVDEMPALRYLVANGEEAFASSLLREWVRGKVFGKPDFLILCSECSGDDIFLSDDFFKISQLEQID